MSSFHEFTCPECKSELLLEVVDAIGGHVQTAVRAMERVYTKDAHGNVVDVQVRPLTPLTGSDQFTEPLDTSPKPLPAEPAFPGATAAAVAHAEAVGVDLAEVEGTGKGGVITKTDVAAAVEPTPEEKKK